jgi:hypothetical protein
MTPQRLFLSVLVMAPIVYWSPALASEASHEGIGLYTAVSGHVVVTHRSEGRVVPVKLHDQVWFKDVIETKGDSRTKAFFDDDSMLTVGTNSRVEIDEYVYQPDKNVRRAIVKLMQGQVRTLVSKVFKANGSKFEVHTPSAVAAARGTYFTVWIENGQSGIINIGETGRVDFTSGGVTVAVDPGYFSVAREGQAPSTPMEHHLGRAHSETEATPSAGLAQALVAVERTLLREELLLASAIELSIGPLSAGPVSLGPLSANPVSVGPVSLGPLSVGPVSVSPVSLGPLSVGPLTAAPTVVVPALTLPTVTVAAPTVIPIPPIIIAPVTVVPTTPVLTVPVTPPAVISGALNLLKP